MTELTKVGQHIARAQGALGPLVARDPAVRPCWDELNLAAVALTSAGVRVSPGEVPPCHDPLDLTRWTRSTQEGEALLIALESLLPLAEALDKARGDWVGDMASTHLGETPGTNYAEAVQELHLRLLEELRGRVGRGLE